MQQTVLEPRSGKRDDWRRCMRSVRRIRMTKEGRLMNLRSSSFPRFLLMTLLAVALVLPMTGCGGDDDEDDKGYTPKQVRLLSEWYLRVRKSQ